ncbi:MAPK kinase substrate protein At1g80180 [Pistacia vera]|uniref:MAPK kinase substrate protein At1g80180 n=1 Tax=Pistacia vera TaxID=55513 RepID=UPI0012635BC9|nr:MAPK kinase substrate protein At1g80180 [Pistacia vera]
MAGLQRSAASFRRQGSSGLVWDDKFLSGELKRHTRHKEAADKDDNKGELRLSQSVMMQRSRSEGGGGGRTYRTAKVPSPNRDPPSPKVSGCCGFFGKPEATRKPRKPNKRKS